MEKLKAIRGMNDILPDESFKWEAFEHVIREWAASFGYKNLRTPILESTNLFVRSIGEVTDIVEKEMYSFSDRLNGEELTLRPEGTASAVRAVIEHNLTYSAPQRVYYMGPMFRHERPQKGRYRQFHQVGVESMGIAGSDIDAEHILMGASLWRELGLEEISLEVNSLGSLEDRAAFKEALVGYLTARRDELDEDSIRRLTKNPLRILDSKNPDMQGVIEGAPKLSNFLSDKSQNIFDEFKRVLDINRIDFRINPTLVRGLDYYNDIVYEWKTEKLGSQGTICAGGRYDGLSEQIGGKAIPACGFAMGIERILALVDLNSRRFSVKSPDAYLIYSGQGTDVIAWETAQRFRADGISCVLHCGGGSFKSQMKRADSSGANFAVIVGEEELSQGGLTVKPLRTGDLQQTVKYDAAIALIKDARDS
jgi:histidyl-tRNA synthetase